MQMNQPLFHVKDGLYFQRVFPHHVIVIKTTGKPPENYRGPAYGEEDSSTIIKVEMTECEWASVIASMSATGETSAKYLEALKFHTAG